MSKACQIIIESPRHWLCTTVTPNWEEVSKAAVLDLLTQGLQWLRGLDMFTRHT
jgi:hypothetical protein